MKLTFSRNVKFAITSLLSAVAVYSFYLYLGSGHLHFHEEYQMFMTTSDYFESLIKYPGGLSDYVARFLTNFFVYNFQGALIIAFLLVLLNFFTASFAKKLSVYDFKFHILTLVPCFAFVAFYCNEHCMLSMLISMLFSQAAAFGLIQINNPVLRRALYIISSALVYWIAGCGAYVFAVLFLINEYFKVKSKREFFITSAVSIFLLLIYPPICYQFVDYTLKALYFGVDFYRLPDKHPLSQFVLMLSTALMPFVIYCLNEKYGKRKSKIVFSALFTILCAGGGVYWVSASYNAIAEEVMTYNHFIIAERWDGIIKMANKQKPLNEMSISVLNCALAKKGILLDSMFNYYQCGYNGLIPNWKTDMVTAIPVAEVYFQMSNVNTALRYNFEIMSATYDYQKSSHAFIRMVEANIINKDYKIARKYCTLLSKTLYYNDLAKYLESLTYSEEAFENNSKLVQKRELRYKRDFCYQRKNPLLMLCAMMEDSPQNNIVYQYLLGYCLLTKDMPALISSIPYGNKLKTGKIPPKAIGEALTLINAEQLQKGETKTLSVPQEWMTLFNSFVKDMRMNISPDKMNDKWGKTYWFYYYYKKINNEIPDEI